MKMKKIISILSLCVMFIFTYLLTSCKDDLPSAIDSSDKFTVLKSVKIVNAGPDGDKVLIGTIDEDKKIVTFPRVDPNTDFSNLKLEAEVSDGATLERDIYSLQFGETDLTKSIVIKVVNSPRSGEYLASIELKVPPKGAEFSNPTIIDYTNNPLGFALYPSYTGLATRGAAFDGENVLVLSRSGGTNPHLLKLADLKVGTINKLDANNSNITGGTLAIQTGELVGGNMYVANISGTLPASPLKFYYYPNYLTSFASPPQVISFDGSGYMTGPGTYVRYGDNMSYNIDPSGNGTIFSVNNGGTENNLLKIVVSNFTNIIDAKFLPRLSGLTFNATCYRVDKSNQFILTSYDAALRVIDGDGVQLYTDNGAVFPSNATAARVVNFNGLRYLLMLTVPRPNKTFTKLQLYDISAGNNIVEALTLFGAKPELERAPVFDYSFDYITVNAALISQTDWNVIKDEQGKDKILQIFGSLSDAGFAVVEFPVKEANDEDE